MFFKNHSFASLKKSQEQDCQEIIDRIKSFLFATVLKNEICFQVKRFQGLNFAINSIDELKFVLSFRLKFVLPQNFFCLISQRAYQTLALRIFRRQVSFFFKNAISIQSSSSKLSLTHYLQLMRFEIKNQQ
ncbi:hypothetical protein TTHERM_000083539 (macronuclear) [Tetrahymena thermophila SB210]|uniref:Uncharacterized protein n=1 Tax=Tetrahymena thermophila (strain SB210) TaxID=312017 RepID=W7XET1_TETTS|nr:hypothetical protein TTHERM_000083539 [Tetrahymena thermophila SB210]EWS75258.1 hypothetical protein TTHERM_000083539 [Tetrahymena thermophila SB210]|eukprot:XP_012652249.1 hypothetical protein TTHERM_000083539 [Tetrahymena thermophila SB210]